MNAFENLGLKMTCKNLRLWLFQELYRLSPVTGTLTTLV